MSAPPRREKAPLGRPNARAERASNAAGEGASNAREERVSNATDEGVFEDVPEGSAAFTLSQKPDAMSNLRAFHSIPTDAENRFPARRARYRRAGFEEVRQLRGNAGSSQGGDRIYVFVGAAREPPALFRSWRHSGNHSCPMRKRMRNPGNLYFALLLCFYIPPDRRASEMQQHLHPHRLWIPAFAGMTALHDQPRPIRKGLLWILVL